MALSPVTEAEARAIMASGLGKVELELAVSYSAPLYWIMRDDAGGLRARNGTAFFLNTGDAVFGVTACHVLRELELDRSKHAVEAVQMGDTHPLNDLDERIIARDDDIDIATFRVSEAEVRALGKNALTGSQQQWPPGPPQVHRGVYFAGYPVHETTFTAATEIEFRPAAGAGVADSVSDVAVSTVLSRDRWIDVLGRGFPAEGYDFRGISGGPMLSVIERAGVRSWTLAGVVIRGPNPAGEDGDHIEGFEVISARRADFILPNGELDRARWVG
ncbi:MAG: hypothetical protein ABL932_17815 [Terricaulis sp.]